LKEIKRWSWEEIESAVVDFDNKPAREVEFPRKDDATSKLYILTPLV
jgi:hypothetical protein